MIIRELIELLSEYDPDEEIRAESVGWDSNAPGTPEISKHDYEGYLVIGAEE